MDIALIVQIFAFRSVSARVNLYYVIVPCQDLGKFDNEHAKMWSRLVADQMNMIFNKHISLLQKAADILDLILFNYFSRNNKLISHLTVSGELCVIRASVLGS